MIPEILILVMSILAMTMIPMMMILVMMILAKVHGAGFKKILSFKTYQYLEIHPSGTVFQGLLFMQLIYLMRMTMKLYVIIWLERKVSQH